MTGNSVTSVPLSVQADVTQQTVDPTWTGGPGGYGTRTIRNRATGIAVVNASGDSEIYFTVDGSEPTVGGVNCYMVPATIGARVRVRVGVEDEITVKMISDTNTDYHVGFDNGVTPGLAEVEQELQSLQDQIDFIATPSLASLTDVDLVTDPQVDGDVLAWDQASGKWMPATVVGGVDNDFVYAISFVGDQTGSGGSYNIDGTVNLPALGFFGIAPGLTVKILLREQLDVEYNRGYTWDSDDATYTLYPFDDPFSFPFVGDRMSINFDFGEVASIFALIKYDSGLGEFFLDIYATKDYIDAEITSTIAYIDAEIDALGISGLDERRWEYGALWDEWNAIPYKLKTFPTGPDLETGYGGTWEVTNGSNNSGTLPHTPDGIDMRGFFKLDRAFRDDEVADPARAYPFQRFREIFTQTKLAATGGDLTEWALRHNDTVSGLVDYGTADWFYESTLQGAPGEGAALLHNDGAENIGIPIRARLTHDVANETVTFWRGINYDTGEAGIERTDDGYLWYPLFSETDARFASMDDGGMGDGSYPGGQPDPWRLGIQNNAEYAWFSVYHYGGGSAGKILDIQPSHIEGAYGTTSFVDGVGNTISTTVGEIIFDSDTGVPTPVGETDGYVLSVSNDELVYTSVADATGASTTIYNCDWAVKTFSTGGTVPAVELFPGDDVAAWEAADASAIGVVSGGGPAVWNVPVDQGTQRIAYADLIDPSRDGVYIYTPGVSFVRDPKADTTADLHGCLMLSKLHRNHTDNSIVATAPYWIPNLVYMQAVDPNAAIGTTGFEFVLFTDLITTQIFFDFLTSMTGLGWTPDAADWDGAAPANFGEALDRLAERIPSPVGQADGKVLTVQSNALVYASVASGSSSASAVSVDASGFDGNLDVTDDTVQKVAQKLDDLSVLGGINDLTDVDTVTDPPAQDDVLAWDAVGGEWSPATLNSTPDAHANTHELGGTDALAIDASQVTFSVTTTAVNLTLNSTHSVVEVTAAATITLPTAVGITGRSYNVKNTGSGVVVIDGNGSETIDGVLTQSLNQWDAVTIVSNGTGWIII